MKNFIKNYSFRQKKVIINLQVKDIPLTMDNFPLARKILKRNLPSIFKSRCFNPNNLSFYKESKNTEVGHLFEHILLEYMCLFKVPYVNEVSFSGRTYWNSKKMTGNFRVEISCEMADVPFFIKALDNGILLMDKIFESAGPSNIRRQSAVQTAPYMN